MRHHDFLLFQKYKICILLLQYTVGAWLKFSFERVWKWNKVDTPQNRIIHTLCSPISGVCHVVMTLTNIAVRVLVFRTKNAGLEHLTQQITRGRGGQAGLEQLKFAHFEMMRSEKSRDKRQNKF